MKTLVLTISIGDFYQELSRVTHPHVEDYAKKIGADFINITETKLPFPHYAKFEIGRLLEQYDRVLYLDTDILVSPNTPNIFDVVPAGRIGMLDESPLGYDQKFEEFLKEHASQLVEKWSKQRKCYNAGVIVCSKIHKNIFKLPENFPDHYFEQSYLNLRIIEEGVEVFSLPPEYNRMIYLDLVLKEHRLKSYIVHYAGFLKGRSIEECIKFLEKEYSMMLSQDFSADDFHIAWAPV